MFSQRLKERKPSGPGAHMYLCLPHVHKSFQLFFCGSFHFVEIQEERCELFHFLWSPGDFCPTCHRCDLDHVMHLLYRSSTICFSSSPRSLMFYIPQGLKLFILSPDLRQQIFLDESKRAVIELKECVHDKKCEAIQWLMEYCKSTTITNMKWKKKIV